MRAVVVTIAMVFGTGCGDPTKGSVDGKELFGMICANCHGPRGKPTPQMAARYGSRDLTDPKFRSKLTEMLVENQIRNGSKNKIMPAYDGMIADPQIKAIAAFVASPEFLSQSE